MRPSAHLEKEEREGEAEVFEGRFLLGHERQRRLCLEAPEIHDVSRGPEQQPSRTTDSPKTRKKTD